MAKSLAFPWHHDSFEGMVSRIIAGAIGKPSRAEQQRTLSDLLDRVESKLLHFRDRLLCAASSIPNKHIQAIVDEMRDDEQLITSLCIHRCDREDPQVSINHDLINNDYSLNLQQKLAAAQYFGISPRRVVLLCRLQREICRQLGLRGIETSQN